ncbi:MAG: hypothetical protein V1816_17830 [Pseudomonadota bacterium]
MRCPKCGFNSFDYNEACPKCGRDLGPTRQLLGLAAVVPQPMPYLDDLISRFEAVAPEPAPEASSSARLGDYEAEDFKFEDEEAGLDSDALEEVKLGDSPEDLVELEAPDEAPPAALESDSGEIEFDLDGYGAAETKPSLAKAGKLDETDELSLEHEGPALGQPAEPGISFGESTFIMEDVGELRLDDSPDMNAELGRLDDEDALDMDIEAPELDFGEEQNAALNTLGRTMVLEPEDETEEEEEEEEVLTLDGFQDDDDILTLDALEEAGDEVDALGGVEELDLEDLVLEEPEEGGAFPAMEDKAAGREPPREPGAARFDPNSTMVMESADFSKYALVEDEVLLGAEPAPPDEPEPAVMELEDVEFGSVEEESEPSTGDGLNLGDFELGLDDIELDSGALKLVDDLSGKPAKPTSSSSDEFDLDSLELEDLTLGDDDSQTE